MTHKVPNTPMLAHPPLSTDADALHAHAGDQVKALTATLFEFAQRLNNSLPLDGSEHFEITDHTNAAGPILTMHRHSDTPADNDQIGAIHFSGMNSAAEEVNYARIRAYMADVTDATEDGWLAFQVTSGGNENNWSLTLTPSGMRLGTGGPTAPTSGIFHMFNSSFGTSIYVESGNSGAEVHTVSGAGAAAIFNANRGSTGNAAYMRYQTGGTNAWFVGMQGGLTSYDILNSSSQLVFRVASDATFTFRNSNPGAGGGPDLVLWRDSSSPAANDVLGQVRFHGEDSAGNETTFGQVRMVMDDPTNGSEDGHLSFFTILAGTNAERLTIGEGGFVLTTIAGAADATDYTILNDTSGNEGTTKFKSRTVTGLGASAATVATTGSSNFGALIMVHGHDGASDEFMDMLHYSDDVLTELHKLGATPANRTYSYSAPNVNLANSAGTWETRSLTIQIG